MDNDKRKTVSFGYDAKTQKALEILTAAHPESNTSDAIRRAIQDRAAKIKPGEVLNILTARLQSLTAEREGLTREIQNTKQVIKQIKQHR